MLSEYEVKFMADMCGRREAAEKGGENLRLCLWLCKCSPEQQGRKARHPLKASHVPAMGMKGASERNGRHS